MQVDQLTLEIIQNCKLYQDTPGLGHLEDEEEHLDGYIALSPSRAQHSLEIVNLSDSDDTGIDNDSSAEEEHLTILGF